MPDGPPQALKNLTHVRITAVVQSDDRVTYDAPRQDSAASSQTITGTRRDESYRWVKQHSSSTYANGSTELLRDDADADGPMADEISRRRENREALGLDVSFSIPWIEFSYHVGDRVMDIDGRGVSFARKPGGVPSYPMIREISYDFEEHSTRLEFFQLF